MARLTRTCLALLLVVTAIPALASRNNMYMDVLAGYADVGDARGQIATGMGLGIDVAPSLMGITRIQYSFRPATYMGMDAFYSHTTVTAGFGYTVSMDPLKSLGLLWQTSVLMGFGTTSIDMKDIGKESDQGLTVQAFTGLRYNFMQHVAPFFEIGWSHSFYNNTFTDNKIYGFQALVGCRFSLYPMMRLGDEY